jgi:hypothetical protein
MTTLTARNRVPSDSTSFVIFTLTQLGWHNLGYTYGQTGVVLVQMLSPCHTFEVEESQNGPADHDYTYEIRARVFGVEQKGLKGETLCLYKALPLFADQCTGRELCSRISKLGVSLNLK